MSFCGIKMCIVSFASPQSQSWFWSSVTQSIFSSSCFCIRIISEFLKLAETHDLRIFYFSECLELSLLPRIHSSKQAQISSNNHENKSAHFPQKLSFLLRQCENIRERVRNYLSIISCQIFHCLLPFCISFLSLLHFSMNPPSIVSILSNNSCRFASKGFYLRVVSSVSVWENWVWACTPNLHQMTSGRKN